jgi:hypothetical protein
MTPSPISGTTGSDDPSSIKGGQATPLTQPHQGFNTDSAGYPGPGSRVVSEWSSTTLRGRAAKQPQRRHDLLVLHVAV